MYSFIFKRNKLCSPIANHVKIDFTWKSPRLFYFTDFDLRCPYAKDQ